MSDLRRRESDGVARLSVLAPESGAAPQRYNVGVAFDPGAIQATLEQQRIPDGAIASVLDREFQTIARTRDPEKWLGKGASADTIAAARLGGDRNMESLTREGERTVGFVTHSQRYGWSVAIGLPRTALDKPAVRVTIQAFAAALILAIIGLVAALWFARAIRGPVLALNAAADELGRERVPAPLKTRLAEVDAVGAALHEAGLRSARATELLESRVAEAIRQTQEAQTRLLDGQKHEAIGRLTGGLAHDLNNFLQTMSTGLQVLDRLTKEESGRRVIEASTRALNKAAALVRQMLAFGRAQPLKPQPIDIHDFVLRCEDLMGRAVGGRVRLTADIEPDLPPLMADPTQLELALLNLVFNARDAMPDGGTVVIRGRLAGAAQTAGLAPGRYLAVDVVDTGAGRHGRRGVATRVRAVLHDQAGGRGQRPRAAAGARVRRAVRRRGVDPQRARGGHHRVDRAAGLGRARRGVAASLRRAGRLHAAARAVRRGRPARFIGGGARAARGRAHGQALPDRRRRPARAA